MDSTTHLTASGTSPTTMLSLKQAATEVGVTDRTIRNWIAGGRLAAVRVGPKVIRIRRGDLDALLSGSVA